MTPAAATTTTAATDASAKAAAKASTASSKLSSDKTQFLKLLTAQLRNQDPTAPMDSTQFTQQLVQYSQVEQQIDTNSNLSSLISLTQQNIFASALNYVGKAIQANSDTAPLQNGALTASYKLSGDAQSTTILVRDSTGAIVHSEVGAIKAGAHAFKWDGKSSGGAQLADGNYSVTVTALGANNTPVDSTVSVYGTVTSVVTDPTTNAVTLMMGGVSVPLNKVLAIG